MRSRHCVVNASEKPDSSFLAIRLIVECKRILEVERCHGIVVIIAVRCTIAPQISVQDGGWAQFARLWVPAATSNLTRISVSSRGH